MENTDKDFSLLIGYEDAKGDMHKDFEVKEMTGQEEEIMARPDIQANGGRLVTALLTSCCTRIGEYQKSSMKEKQWEDIIRSLYIGDRDLLLLKLRQITFGDEIEMKPQCPSCGNSFTYILDTEDIEILPVKDDMNPKEIPFELKKGIYHKKTDKTYKGGVLRMTTGADQEALAPTARKNMGQANTLLITRIVKEIGPVSLNSMVFRNLTLPDREIIIKTLSEHRFGPRLITEIMCPSCGHDFETAVSIANFF